MEDETPVRLNAQMARNDAQRNGAAAEAGRRLDHFLRRFAYVRRTNVETFARRFAELIKAGPPPRDPCSLLARVGVRIECAAIEPPLRARWKLQGDHYVITVPEHEPPPARAFAAWREMFFLLAARPGFPTALSDSSRERLANRFASAVLMPPEAVESLARRFASNQEALAEVLADKFGVSVTAMRRRLYELEILRPRSRAVHLPRAADEREKTG